MFRGVLSDLRQLQHRPYRVQEVVGVFCAFFVRRFNYKNIFWRSGLYRNFFKGRRRHEPRWFLNQHEPLPSN
jgi:hypothetical protein